MLDTLKLCDENKREEPLRGVKLAFYLHNVSVFIHCSIPKKNLMNRTTRILCK